MTGKFELFLVAALVLAALLRLGLVAAPGDGDVPTNDGGFTSAGLAWNKTTSPA